MGVSVMSVFSVAEGVGVVVVFHGDLIGVSCFGLSFSLSLL